MSEEKKQAMGGPFDGEWFPTVDKVLIVPMPNDSGRFASYTDVGLHFKFDNIYYSSDDFEVIAEDEEESSDK